MELLRIVAMSMIVIGHCLTHGLRLRVPSSTVYCIAEPFFICGVNLFFLISGWFGIRFTLSSLVRLIVTTLFFIGVNIIAIYIAGSEVTWSLVADTLLFPVSRGNYWFIMVYMALMILAPLLNAGIRSMGDRQLVSFVLLLSLFNLYSCSVGNNYVSFNGYTIMQAVWLYCVSSTLRRFSPVFCRVRRYLYLIAFFGFTACGAAMLLLTRNWDYMEYNSIFVVLPSVSLFLYFTRLDFKNRFINRLAPAAFGCYLLQDGLFGRQYGYKWIGGVYRHVMHDSGPVGGTVRIIILILMVLLTLWILSMILTPIADKAGRLVGKIVTAANRKVRILLTRAVDRP